MPLTFRRSYVDRRVFIALSAMALFSLVTTIVTIGAVNKMANARQVGAIYTSARVAVGDLNAQLGAAESGERGYLLTADENYLKPYTVALTAIPVDLKTIKDNLSGTSYEGQIKRLSPAIQTKLDELKLTIEAFRSGGQPAALVLITSGQSQAQMAGVTSVTGAMLESLDTDVNNSRVAVTHYADLAREVGLLALGGTLVLVVGIYFLFDHAIEADRALDRAKDEFVSLASHQLRTPATGIKSILSMLDAGDFGPLTEKQHSAIGKAILSNQRELNIIEELLNVAKADAGRLVLNPTEVNLTELLDTIVSEQREAIRAKGIEVKLKHPSAPVKLMADEEKLYMAISNLVDNARKYTPTNGHIHVTLSTNSRHISVEVADDGIGIEEHELDHIFDRFQRARMVLAGTIEGTGLGLYLARRIAELHHGTINVESKKDHGSKFIMVLPKRTQA